MELDVSVEVWTRSMNPGKKINIKTEKLATFYKCFSVYVYLQGGMAKKDSGGKWVF